MRSDYKLFQSHLDLAYHYWQSVVELGDIVIDATCGNGKDTLKLAQLALEPERGALYAYDIQAQAIATTQEYLAHNLSPTIISRIKFMLANHNTFDDRIHPSSVKLIVYNLGYLPGGNKTLTTQASTTTTSLQAAIHLIAPGGAISITCYPGHPAGIEEEKCVLEYAASLNPKEWSSCYHQWLNRKAAPSLLLLQKCK